MLQRLTSFIAFILVLFISLPSVSFADEVKKVYPDGRIELSDGELVELAGIKLTPESVKLIPMLLAGQSVRVDYAKEFRNENPQTLKQTYLYLKVKELEFPLGASAKPNQSKVMINELLLEMGAAWVLIDIPFSKQKKFLEIQERAKATGQGVWSYTANEQGLLKDF